MITNYNIFIYSDLILRLFVLGDWRVLAIDNCGTNAVVYFPVGEAVVDKW